jgi:hypothetical protein
MITLVHESIARAVLIPLAFACVLSACDAGETSGPGPGALQADDTGGTTSTPSPPDVAGNGGGPSAASAGAPATGTGGSGDAASGGANTTGAGGESMSSGMLLGSYDWQPVTYQGRNYIVQNNVWGSGASQTVSYDGTSVQITEQTGSNSTSGGPVSYPSVFVGSNYNRSTDGSNLPKLVSSLTTITTSWSVNAGSVSGTYNAAYDVWFSTSASGDMNGPSGGYLMVWLYKPQDAQPIGSVVASNVTIPGATGTWQVWLGDNGSRPCISYVHTPAATSLSFDLNQFIKDASQNHGAPIKSSWYLSNVFAGFEIWKGGVGLKGTNFSVVVD